MHQQRVRGAPSAFDLSTRAPNRGSTRRAYVYSRSSFVYRRLKRSPCVPCRVTERPATSQFTVTGFGCRSHAGPVARSANLHPSKEKKKPGPFSHHRPTPRPRLLPPALKVWPAHSGDPLELGSRSEGPLGHFAATSLPETALQGRQEAPRQRLTRGSNPPIDAEPQSGDQGGDIQL